MITRRDLPLSALRAFESAALHLHLGKAGEALGVTHGAISHQIKALESRLGSQLFIREKNTLKLSAPGLRLYAAVKDGLDRLIDGMVNLNPESLEGTLTIGCTQSTATNWAIRHIMEFQERYPDVEITVVEIAPGESNIPRNIDIAICYGKPAGDNRIVEQLSKPPVFPVCSPRLLYGTVEPSHAEQLKLFHLLDDSQNSWKQWFSAMQVETSDKLRQTRFFNTTLALQAARDGYGVALGNPFEIHDDLKEGRLIILLKQSIPESNAYYLLIHERQNESIRARLFREWLKVRL
jgi:LysR family transcriptional regulator, glycine cleavage system transcriptional activator